MPPRHLARTVFIALLTLCSLLVGALSLRYVLPGTPFPVDLDNLVDQRALFLTHVVSAAVALMVGPFQFLAGLRHRRPALHRVLGRVYVVAVAIGGASALPLAARAQTGLVASVGFLLLALLWAVATWRGVALARARRFGPHRAWMVRSFALTCAAITLRIYLGTSMALDIPFALAYPAIAWLCWVPNALCAEAYLAWERRDTTAYRAPRGPVAASHRAT